MKELVSIITPCHNSEKFIKKTIESVLSQTYENWEMIIVDDVSSDKSYEIAKEYANKDKRINAIRLKQNSGPAVARNKAIEMAKGRYIAFLDSDDLWKREKLQKQINFMKENDYAFTYSAYELIDENDNLLDKIFIPPKKISYKDMLKTCSIGCLTAMYDTKQLGKVYMPLIKKGQDYATWLKILKMTDYAYGLQESLAIYRIRAGSVSRNKFRAINFQWKIYREVEKLGIVESLYYLMNYIYYGLKKYK